MDTSDVVLSNCHATLEEGGSWRLPHASPLFCSTERVDGDGGVLWLPPKNPLVTIVSNELGHT